MRLNLTYMLLGALCALGVTASAAQAQSTEQAYSSVEENCLLFSVDEVGASMVCKGVAGFNLIIHDSDARIYLELVHPDWSETARLATSAVNSSFSSLPSRVVEWRLRGGAPIALIARLLFQSGDGSDQNLLLVSRIDKASPQNTCLVGAVRTNADAVKMAERANRMPCLQ